MQYGIKELAPVQVKSLQYTTVVIPDPGHLDDPEFLEALNVAGLAEGPIKCPRCGKGGCAVASGFKRSEEHVKGSKQLVVLLEREIISQCGSEPSWTAKEN